MFNFKGTVTGTVTSQAYNLPIVIKSFRLVNVSGGSNTVNVKVINDGDLNIVPKNLTLNAGDMLEDDQENLMLQGVQIEVSSTAALVYNFTLDNIPGVPTPP